ncbi:uncharacterized protein LOC110989953 isoform X2 [Acanthaster planci]|uniref:Uncharacterized protein LOC110989953 isoform X2 n=1 Tax=Acanthaster planci TaxID=133434 RepID=A0A8B7ZZ42_ACAPL|nr:uncharacterized protein LOC110989953 isoform X2 [Acanthaster planci]
MQSGLRRMQWSKTRLAGTEVYRSFHEDDGARNGRCVGSISRESRTDLDEFSHIENDEDDSDVSRSTDSEISKRRRNSSFSADYGNSDPDSDEELEQWMEITAGVEG